MDWRDSGYFAEMDTSDPMLSPPRKGVLRTLPLDTDPPPSDQTLPGPGKGAGEIVAVSDSGDSHRNSVFLSGRDDSFSPKVRGVLESMENRAPIGGENNIVHGSVRLTTERPSHRGRTRVLGTEDPEGISGGSMVDKGSAARKGVHRTLGKSNSVERSRSDVGSTLKTAGPHLRHEKLTRAPRYRKNSHQRDAMYFHNDSRDSATFSDSYDINGNEDLDAPSASHEPDDDGVDKMADGDYEGEWAQMMSPDLFVFWEGPVSSPLPKEAVIRSNSVSIPLSKLSLPDLVQGRREDRWSQPVFQYATLERTHPSVGAVEVRAQGESWGAQQSASSKSESDLRILGGAVQESPISATRAPFHASNPVLSTPANVDTLESFEGRIHEGYLWLNNIQQGTQTKTWCIVHQDLLLMFGSNHPQARVLERWTLTGCKVTPVTQKVALDLLVRFPTHHSFQIKRATGKKSVFSAQKDYLCKEWIQKLTATSNIYNKRKGSRLSIPTFSLRAHFTKSARRKNNAGPGPAPRMTRKSFDDIYGWSEAQSHKRTNQGPAKENVQRSKTEKKRRETGEESFRQRANSDTNLSRQAKKESVDRSVSAEASEGGGKFGSLRRTLKKLPRSIQPGAHSPPVTRAHSPIKMTQSIPLEPSVRAGLLLVKRFTSWNRCWVKLHGTSLHFFKDRDEQLPFEVVSLVGYEVHCIPPSPNPGRQVRFKFSLVALNKESIHFLADTELDGRLWVKRFMEACTTTNMGSLDKNSPSSILTKSGDVFDDADPNGNDNSHSDASGGSPTESPILRQRRIMIQRRYQQASETEEMNAMKRSLVLTQRRMSAQTKLEALDKKFGARLAAREGTKDKSKKRRYKSGEKKLSPVADEAAECDDASIKEILDELHRKVKDIDRELDENVLRSDQRKQALLKKQEMELEILQQERELLRCRSAAQAALKSMMEKSAAGGSQTQLHRLVEESREDDPGFANGDYGQLREGNIRNNSPSVSSSMSSLSSSGTSDSSSMGSAGHSNPKLSSSPRIERAHRPTDQRSGQPTVTSDSSGTRGSGNSNQKLSSPRVERANRRFADSVDGPGQLTVNRPIRDRHSPAVSTPDLRRIPEDGFLVDEGSVEAPAILVTPGIREKRTEVPLDVLRDIDEFEEMAKVALKKAGWLPLDAV